MFFSRCSINYFSQLYVEHPIQHPKSPCLYHVYKYSSKYFGPQRTEVQCASISLLMSAVNLESDFLKVNQVNDWTDYFTSSPKNMLNVCKKSLSGNMGNPVRFSIVNEYFNNV